MVNYKRGAKKFAKKVYKKVVEPYTDTRKGRGYKNRMNLYKEVQAIKKMVNAEKKNADTISTTTVNFAEKNGAASGGNCFDIMPTISQGNTEDQRNGDSLKVCSAVFQFEVSTNSFNTTQATRYKIYIIRQPTNPVSTATAYINLLEPNAFSSVIDYNSNRDYEHYKDFIVMKTINGYLKQNTNDSANQVQKNQHKVAMKCNYHVRYEKGTTTILNNPIYAVVVADSGDVATTNFIRLQYSTKIYFYDN